MRLPKDYTFCELNIPLLPPKGYLVWFTCQKARLNDVNENSV